MNKSITLQLNTAQENTFNRVIKAQTYMPNIEQQNVCKAILATDKNIVVNAKAGSGKTTLLRLLVEVIPSSASIALIAFNKSIVKELKSKFSGFSNVDIRTSHSMGMKIIRSSGIKTTVDNNKTKKVLKEYCEKWEWNEKDKETLAQIEAIEKLSNIARLSLIKDQDFEALSELAEKHDVLDTQEVLEKTFIILKVMAKRFNMIDFTDMVFYPAIGRESKGVFKYPKYDFVLVDECQDLSKAQQALVSKILKKGGRSVFVGDPKQAIYGFAGADAESFTRLTQRPNCIEMPLNECFRCGKNIIQYVNDNVEDEIRAYKGNSDGVVNHDASVNVLRDGDFVMCRNTLPLIKLCFYLLARNKPATIKGKEIGSNLISIIKKSKKESLEYLFNWCDKQLEKLALRLAKKHTDKSEEEIKALESYVNTQEKYDILKLISNHNEDVKCATTLKMKINSIFSDDVDGIVLSTIHKAKGLEAKRCFVIERDLMPSKYAVKDWQKVQETNLQYVCYTRAQEQLNFITDWNSKETYTNDLEISSHVSDDNTQQDNSTEIQERANEFIGKVGGDRELMTLVVTDIIPFASNTMYEMVDADGRKVLKLGKINERYFISRNKVRFYAEITKHQLKKDKECITIINRISHSK